MNFRFFVVFCNHIKGTDMELVVQKNSTKTNHINASYTFFNPSDMKVFTLSEKSKNVQNKNASKTA